MIFGVDYYPEHWPAARWEQDARQMRDLGITLVRVAEFAWARLEPEEGRFEFDWLDRAITVLHQAGLQVILGTPTASPPAWLSRGYPETLPVDDQGRRRNFGARRHYCPNHPLYRRFSQMIVAAMARRYGQDERIAGWQIDNEFGGGHTARCYCPECERAFREWLQRTYGSLHALNEAWGTVFWSQEYRAWEQIGAPILTGSAPNPSHMLDYYRFSSDSFVAYQQLQIDELTAQIDRPRQFITHNFMGLFPDLNYHHLAAPLDFATWDNYPTGNLDRWRSTLYGEEAPPAVYAYDTGDPLVTGMAHDLTRGLTGKPFWVMEQQPGAINWGVYNQGIRPGTVRLWTWHALAHGASHIVYFRWRACLLAQEQYHAGLLHHDGTPDVGYTDLQAMQAEHPQLLEAAQQPVEPAQVALLCDYDNLWALEIQPHRRGFTYLGVLFLYYRALMQLGIPVDVIGPAANLAPYRLVIAPAAHLNRPEAAAALAQFAAGGGSLLFGVRTGFKTPSNMVVQQPLPGIYRDLVGAVVTDWHALHPAHPYPVSSAITGLSGQARIWSEALQPDPGTEVLAEYTGGPFQGRAALTYRAHASGRVVYQGWHPDLPQAQGLMLSLANELGLTRLAEIPPGLVARARGRLLFLLNFTDQPLQAQVGGAAVSVPPRDVRVLPRDGGVQQAG